MLLLLLPPASGDELQGKVSRGTAGMHRGRRGFFRRVSGVKAIAAWEMHHPAGGPRLYVFIAALL